MTEPTPLDKAIQILGGPVKAARKLDISRYQTLQQWRRNRVPAEYCPALERETGGAVRCEHLRPDIDWGYVRNHPSAESELPEEKAT